ncbi:MAG TPA: penicillin-binding transpeptidase domain-containing protein [Acidimicrobiales bacterium]|nr:penicillin-binding transpeptidase domain-containing protein [Acidimicrobiales bacterium]
MKPRRVGRRRRFPGRLDLPGESDEGSLDRLRRVMAKSVSSPLAAVESERRTSGARQSGRPRVGMRLSVTAVVVAGLFAVLLVRLWSIQVIHVHSAVSQELITTTRTIQTTSPRGEIIARGGMGQVLATDVPQWVVTLDRSEANNPALQQRLAVLLGVSTKHITSQFADPQLGPFAPVPIAPVAGSTVPASTILELLGHPKEYPGVTPALAYQRSYPQGSLAAQILGYIGPLQQSELKYYLNHGYQVTDSVGQSGLESYYELPLRGKPGTETLEVDPNGNIVKQLATTQPVQGDTVQLNLDLPLEQMLSSALANHVQALRSGSVPGGAQPAPWAAAVVLDVHTGAVLAIASYPGYNANLWVGGISSSAYAGLVNEAGHPLDNYAVANPQPPGSTFKLATATAALNDNLITPSYTYDDRGSYVLPGGQVLHDAGGESLGVVNVTSALAASSDIFFYNLGARFWNAWASDAKHYPYGQTPIQDTAAAYGLGQEPGVDLPSSEVNPGQVDSPLLRKILHAAAPAVYPNTYYLGDNVELAFGQGYTEVTPLQLADAYATFANGGTRYAPELAAALVGPNGNVVERIRPKVMSHVHFASQTDYQAILQGFEGAVTSSIGTATGAFQGYNFSSWIVGGKTGTASTTSNNSVPDAWFAAFGGPKSTGPEYAVAVEVGEAGYGASAAAPVAAQVLAYLKAHGLPPLRLPGAAPAPGTPAK